MKLTEKQIKQCNERLRKEDISKISTGNFSKVYVSGAYVKNKLNEIFGIGNWSYTYELNSIKQKTATGEVKKNGYMAKVSLTIGDLVLSDIGTGELKNNYFVEEDKGRKGAITDGLKRCAVNLGSAFGLNIIQDAKFYKIE